MKLKERKVYINGDNRPRDLELEKAVKRFDSRKSATSDLEKRQRRLASVGGNEEIYRIVFGEPGEYPFFE